MENRVKEIIKDDKEDQKKPKEKKGKEEEEAGGKQAREEKKRKIIEELNQKEELLREELSRMQAEANWLESYATKQNSPNGGVKLTIQQAEEFMAFYRENLGNFDRKKDEIEAELKEIEEKRRGLVETRNVKSVFLLLQGVEGELDFALTYVVSNASWEPAYDIRVVSSKEKDQVVELTYFGVITNSTEENWLNVELALSTAQPQIGGGPPPLKTNLVRFYVPRARAAEAFTFTSKKLKSSGKVLEKSFSLSRNRNASMILEAEPKSQAVATLFKIPRRANIGADHQPHKVGISVINLESSFSYVAIPKKSQHAYLRCKSTNKTSYPFLEGTVNVFMEDTFVATSHFKAANPGEEISMYLGSDPMVVVDIKESAFKENKGMFSKTVQARYLHSISVKNTKNKPIKCDIFDQLPRSQEDRIKVVVLRPQLEGPQDSTAQNSSGAGSGAGGNKAVFLAKTHSVRWQPTIASGTAFTVDFEYQVEYPADKNIDFFE